MSRKRVASSAQDMLTGGTYDVNPQYLSGQIVSAGGAAVEVTLGTPIVRVGQSNPGHAVIMELLKVYVDFPPSDLEGAAVADRIKRFSMSTTSSGATPAIVPLSNPNCLCKMATNARNAFTAAGTGTLEQQDYPQVWDFTDGAGHGVLVATDNLFIQQELDGQNVALTTGFKILYRFKKVSLVEYIGIVQSQQ